MRLILVSCLVALVVLPQTSEARVIFSEIAWMGDSTSANNEWIEIYNDSDSSVTLDGYTITDTGTLNIVLVGTLPARAYGLLERNRSSGQYLATPPFFTYSGALVNTGTTLHLINPGGAVVDQIVGGENWADLGGDNTTKDTAQYTTSGWITASPTPGAPNRTTGTNPGTTPTTTATTTTGTNTNSNPTTSTKSTPKRSSETVRLGTIQTTLALDIDVQAIGYVNQPIPMTVTPRGLGAGVIPSINYEWNFGDMTTSRRRTLTHAYTHPGTYVITVYAAVGEKTAVARHDITILPVTLSLQRLPDASLQIMNNAEYDVDISGYRVGQVTVPPRTVMSPRSSITLPPVRVPTGDQITLRDTAGQVVAVWPTYPDPVTRADNDDAITVVTADITNDFATTPSSPLLAAVEEDPVVPETVPPAPILVLLPDDIGNATGTMPAWVVSAVLLPTAAVDAGTPWWPYVALVLLVMGATGGIIATRTKLGSSEEEIGTITELYTPTSPRQHFPFS